MKSVFITGATDGIGLQAAELFASQGYKLLIHGRSVEKLSRLHAQLAALGEAEVYSYLADLSQLDQVVQMAHQVREQHQKIDVLINNAGVFKVANTTTEQGLDVRFVVNTLAPFLLTQQLWSHFAQDARVVNLSSAAQASVELEVLRGQRPASDDMSAYAQSKLALTQWSCHVGQALASGPSLIAVNPGSLLATNMVHSAFGVAGKDIAIGANILAEAAFSERFANASGRYFDNDSGQFASPHPDGLDTRSCERVIETIELLVKDYL